MLEQADRSECIPSSPIYLSAKSPSETSVVPEDTGLDFGVGETAKGGSSMLIFPKLTDRRTRPKGTSLDRKDVGSRPRTVDMRLSDAAASKVFTGTSGMEDRSVTDMVKPCSIGLRAIGKNQTNDEAGLRKI